MNETVIYCYNQLYFALWKKDTSLRLARATKIYA